jgi:hypothetical protein
MTGKFPLGAGYIYPVAKAAGSHFDSRNSRIGHIPLNSFVSQMIPPDQTTPKFTVGGSPGPALSLLSRLSIREPHDGFTTKSPDAADFELAKLGVPFEASVYRDSVDI